MKDGSGVVPGRDNARNRTMKDCARFWAIAVLVAAVWAGAGCERVPPDVAALKEGAKLELKGDWAGAEAKYAEACSGGNAEAYRRLAELLLNREGTRLFVEARKRDADWVLEARALLERIEMASSQAAARGEDTAGMEATLKTYRQALAVAGERIEKERLAAEEAERKAAEERRLEEERAAAQRAAAEKAAAEKRAAEAAEAARRAEEARKRDSADYCIENGLPLSRGAFREVCRAMNYHQDTGNKIVDNEASSREHRRFRGKRVRLSGSITKVDTKFFGGVKILLNVYGENVWANFPNMPESEGATFRVGQTLTVDGKVEDAPINQFNLGSCNIVD